MSQYRHLNAFRSVCLISLISLILQENCTNDTKIQLPKVQCSRTTFELFHEITFASVKDKGEDQLRYRTGYLAPLYFAVHKALFL